MRAFALGVIAVFSLAAGLPGSAQPTPVPRATTAPYVWGTPPPNGRMQTPNPQASGPVISANLATFTGQLLDIVKGYAYFSTGDAFKLQSAFRVVDYDSGQATTIAPKTKMYARATLEKATGTIIELAITKRPLKTSATYNDVAYNDLHNKYVVVESTKAPAPPAELVHQAFASGKSVPVTFIVEVPISTPLTDSVFISTDFSNWTPNAIRMDRIDARHFRLTRTFASGTKFFYKYTRGTWSQAERGADGLEPSPRPYTVKEADTQRSDDHVYYWSDQNASQPQVGPDAIPTPFNPNPFNGLPSKIPPPHPIAPPPTPH